MDIPVWHDDQQGTATIEVAGAINALKFVGKKLNEASIAMVGAGAANIAIARVLIKAGAEKGKKREYNHGGFKGYPEYSEKRYRIAKRFQSL